MIIYFYTKKDCPLCDKGFAELQLLKKEASFDIEVRDIYTDDIWLEKYQIRIPVIEDKNGNVLDEGIISYTKLKKELLE
ncbi:glutaredoxin family protein [Salipaludibacillus sp. HK11]|uniref:glutaredoxin family protein n=1 Tax=Salipaludibacillus sp. HK11 TaxID=3394320 RepID=UPI0039FCBD8C